MESIANSIIDVENGQEEEDLNKVACRIIRRKAVGALANPSVLTMIAVFLLTNSILLLEEKNNK